MAGVELLICRDLAELSLKTAHLFLRISNEAVTARGRFTAALSGGSTPEALYAVLSNPFFSTSVQWSKGFFFWGDERFVPSDHPDSNCLLAEKHLFSRVAVPRDHIYPVPTGLGDAARAAAEYQRTLESFFSLGRGEFPRFDLMLLGMGEDGHTASLFPGTRALRETGKIVMAYHVDRLKADRITLSVPAINEAANVLFMISGQGKATALGRVLEGPQDPDRYPSQLIEPRSGRLVFAVDRAAAAGLAESA